MQQARENMMAKLAKLPLETFLLLCDTSPGCNECSPDATCVDDVCVCNDGFTGDGFTCKDSCVCRLRGDPIVESYDGQWMLLLGTEKYTMTKYMHPDDPCSFNVEVKAGHANPDARGLTYPRYIDVMVLNARIRMAEDGRVFAGDKELSLPANDVVEGMKIYQQGDFVVVDTECGLKVGFNGAALDSVATVMVPTRYSSKMTGLCGDCDGRLDDLRTDDGVNVQGEDNKYTLISSSYIVDESLDGEFSP